MSNALATVRRLRAALEAGDDKAANEILGEDREWIPPKRTLHGRRAVEEAQVFRWKGTGERAYERRAQIAYVVREGQLARYEMKVLDA